MFRNYCLALFLSTPFLCFSQKIYKDSYIITNDADTIKGFINIKSWNQNPEVVYFRKDSSQETEKLTIGEVKEFVVNGTDKFRRFKVSLSLSRLELNQLPSYPDSSRIEKTVFLRTIFEGKSVVLYTYEDNIKKRFLLSNANTSPTELAFNKYMAGGNVKTSNGYVGQLVRVAHSLNKLTHDVQAKINNAEYAERDLIKVLGLIDSEKAPVYTEYKKVRTTIFVGAKLNRNNFSYRGSGHFLIGGEISNSSSFFPSMSLGLDCYTNKHVEKLLFRTELSLALAESKTTSAYRGTSEITSYHHSLSQQIVSLQPQALYNIYRKKDIKWRMGVGLSLNYSRTTENKYERTDYDLTSSTEAPSKRMMEETPEIEKIYYSMLCRSDIAFKGKLEVGVIYTPRYQISNYSNYNFGYSIWSFNISYPLKSKF